MIRGKIILNKCKHGENRNGKSDVCKNGSNLFVFMILMVLRLKLIPWSQVTMFR